VSRDVIKYGPATLATLEREMDEPVLFDAATLLAASAWRETLARNLRDAAGCALAWRHATHWARELMERGAPYAWRPNCDGKPAPGWER
jgi:hypothetical protein